MRVLLSIQWMLFWDSGTCVFGKSNQFLLGEGSRLDISFDVSLADIRYKYMYFILQKEGLAIFSHHMASYISWE